MNIAELLSLAEYTFFSRAIIVGLLISLCAALLGVSLVLKRYSMIGDGLSHVGFGALAVASALNAAPLAVALPVVIIAAILLLRISGSSRIKGDSAIALISTAALAAGVTVLSVSGGANADLNSYMFGSILALTESDVVLCAVLAGFVLVLFILFYNKIFSVTFDENFSKATGIHTGFYNVMTALLTAVTIVLGMRMMGALLISSLIIFPALTAMRVCKSFRAVTVTAAFVSVICFMFGITGSALLSAPTGAFVVLVDLAVFLLFVGIGALKRN